MGRPRHSDRYWFRGTWKTGINKEPFAVQWLNNNMLEVEDHGFRNLCHDMDGRIVRYEGAPIPFSLRDPMAVWALANQTMKITESGGNVPTMDREAKLKYLSSKITFSKNKFVVTA